MENSTENIKSPFLIHVFSCTPWKEKIPLNSFSLDEGILDLHEWCSTNFLIIFATTIKPYEWRNKDENLFLSTLLLTWCLRPSSLFCWRPQHLKPPRKSVGIRKFFSERYCTHIRTNHFNLRHISIVIMTISNYQPCCSEKDHSYCIILQ